MSSANPAESGPARTAASGLVAVAAPAATRAQTTLIVGLGNPMLGDDGVGWAVVDALERKLLATDPDRSIELDRLAVGGLGLMERLVDHDRAILVDATLTGRALPGTVSWGCLGVLAAGAAGHLDSAHDVSLPLALEAGRALGAHLPLEVAVVAIEADRVDEFRLGLTPGVAAAVPLAAEMVLDLVARTTWPAGSFDGDADGRDARDRLVTPARSG